MADGSIVVVVLEKKREKSWSTSRIYGRAERSARRVGCRRAPPTTHRVVRPSHSKASSCRILFSCTSSLLPLARHTHSKWPVSHGSTTGGKAGRLELGSSCKRLGQAWVRNMTDKRVLQTSRTSLVCAIPFVSNSSSLTPSAEQFVEFYYKTFDENRSALGALYVRNTNHDY